MAEPIFIIVDLFCGFGGTSTGFIDAELHGAKIAKVLACINHDKNAIASHLLNHPEVKHFTEDIRTLDLKKLIDLVNYWRKVYPNALLILWASLECTNFSKAKGGQPRAADSRTLAESLHMIWDSSFVNNDGSLGRYIKGESYIQLLDPDYIQIENVVEFMSWGPLDEKGKPISRKNGQDWLKWRNEICELGYYDEWKEMNSADFGAYTSRNRLFGCFAKNGLPIVWPTPTHCKKTSTGMFGDLKKWMPVKDVLNFSDEGESIFNRKKPLSDKTLERIYAGLIKYVAKGDKSFISKYFSGKPEGKVISTDGPAGTIKTIDSQSLIQAEFLLQTYAANSKGHNTFPTDAPARTITTRDSTALIQPEFLSAYYGTGINATTVNSPCPTISTKDRFQFIQPKYFIDNQYGNGKPSSIDVPSGVLTNIPKLNLVSAEHFIMPTSYDNQPKSIEDPCPTITANRKHHYIVNPSHGGNNTSTEVPCPVIIARQDKAPLYLIQAEEGKIQIAIYENDSEISIRIKQFMLIYNLVDIKMRMLRVLELLRIQGFPVGYRMVGNQSNQKKFIGNSVVPHVVKSWCEAMGKRIISKLKVA